MILHHYEMPQRNETTINKINNALLISSLPAITIPALYFIIIIIIIIIINGQHRLALIWHHHHHHPPTYFLNYWLPITKHYHHHSRHSHLPPVYKLPYHISHSNPFTHLHTTATSTTRAKSIIPDGCQRENISH